MNVSIQRVQPSGFTHNASNVFESWGNRPAFHGVRGRIRLAISLAATIFLLCGPLAAHADQVPSGCSGSGLGIGLFTAISDVRVGQTIFYSINVFNGSPDSGLVVCDASSIQAFVVTPDGVTNSVLLARTTLHQGESDFYTNVVSYVVRARDIQFDGTLLATALEIGIVHQSSSGGIQGVNAEVRVTTGATGLAGTNGINGTNGLSGTNGLNGDVGPVGPAGVAGPTGPMGLAGTNGAAGLNGTNGLSGTNGLNGAVGPVGPAGAAGPTGPMGLAGTNGAAGLNGTNGLSGTNGLNGAVGPVGPAGAVGPTGPIGLAGANGSDGLNGTNGLSGTNGLNGAVGPVGPAGVAGPTGPMGLAGANGSDGLNGTNGLSGTNGLNGDVGPVGPAGANGVNGTNGTSASSQYGYIYNLSAQVVPLETAVTFSNNGVHTAGITHALGSSDMVIVSAGDYKMSFSVSGTEANQFALFINGVAVVETVYGSGAGTQQNTGQAILTLQANDVLTLRNHTSAAAVTLAAGPPIGGTAAAVNASVLIQKLN